jgi:hypothetical protein
MPVPPIMHTDRLPCEVWFLYTSTPISKCFELRIAEIYLQNTEETLKEL